MPNIYETAKSLDVKVRHFQFGLSEKAKSIYEVCKHLEKLSVEILEKSAQFEVSGIAAPMREKEMNPSVRDALTDIVQLAMTNIWKHAAAAHVKMNFKLNGDVFEMDISDDGKGFNVDDAPAIGGVSDMKDIARRIGATLNIDSIPKTPLQNGGTKITFFLTLIS
jgi:two-component system NarL family sensor kinase